MRTLRRAAESVDDIDLSLPEEEEAMRARTCPAEPPVSEAAPAVCRDAGVVKFAGEDASDAIP